MNVDPGQYDADVVLRDGSTVHIRSIRPDDEQRLFEFLLELSAEALELRFSGALSEDALRDRAAELAGTRGYFGLIASVGTGERIVGHAMFARTWEEQAEVAFVVSEDWQGQGLGSTLLVQLAQIAAAQGIRVFEACAGLGPWSRISRRSRSSISTPSSCTNAASASSTRGSG